MKKGLITIMGLLFLLFFTGCSENFTKADKQHIKQNSSLTKEQVLDKTLVKMKAAQGFKFEYEQIIESVVNKSNEVIKKKQSAIIQADYVNDKEFHATIDSKANQDGESRNHTLEAYVKDNKSYTNTDKAKWISSSNTDPKIVIGADFNFFKFVTQLQLIKDNLKDVKYSEDETTYKVELDLTDSNEIKKLVSDLIAQAHLKPDQVQGNNLQVSFTIDKRDFHIVTFEQKENLISTLPDRKVNFTLTRTLNWKGSVTSITVPVDVKQVSK